MMTVMSTYVPWRQERRTADGADSVFGGDFKPHYTIILLETYPLKYPIPIGT